MKYNFDRRVDRRGTDTFKWDKLAARFGRDDIISMWIADMEFETPVPVRDALKKRCDHGIFGYTFRSDAYHDAVRKWVKARSNWEIKNEWICFCPGIVPALSLCVNTFTRPGDKVITQTPVYPPFYTVVKKNGRRVVENRLKYELNQYTIDFERLAEDIRLKSTPFTSSLANGAYQFDPAVKMMLFCNPHNPTGRVWQQSELERIGRICLENNILIVSDDIHCDLVYRKNQYIPIASLSRELQANTITCISPGKTFNLTGLATSAIIIPDEKLRQAYNNTLETLELDGGNIFGAIATTQAYTHGEDWLDQLLAYLENNLNFLLEYFDEKIPLIKPVKPEGTFLVWLDCTGLGLEGLELMDFFVNQAGLAVNPGDSFGKDSSRFVRMNMAFPKKVLETALNRLEAAVKSRLQLKQG